jgi:hypothetical protein
MAPRYLHAATDSYMSDHGLRNTALCAAATATHPISEGRPALQLGRGDVAVSTLL